MATQAQRLERITRIIQADAIHSQQELQARLERGGIAVTQATLSRDLARLGVLKGAAGYVLPPPGAAPAAPAMGGAMGAADDVLLSRVLRRELRAADAAGNLIIIRTDAGHANALAIELDRARPPEVVGTIAGDDTIFLAARNRTAATRFVKRLKSLTAGD